MRCTPLLVLLVLAGSSAEGRTEDAPPGSASQSVQVGNLRSLKKMRLLVAVVATTPDPDTDALVAAYRADIQTRAELALRTVGIKPLLSNSTEQSPALMIYVALYKVLSTVFVVIELKVGAMAKLDLTGAHGFVTIWDRGPALIAEQAGDKAPAEISIEDSLRELANEWLAAQP